MIAAGESDQCRVIVAAFWTQRLNRDVHVEKNISPPRIRDEALDPEERGKARAARYRRDLMQSGGWIEKQVPGGKLDPLAIMPVLNQ